MDLTTGSMTDAHAGRMNILLMEDEPAMALGLRMVLTEEGYGVDLAETGKNALDTLDKKGFDLLVADLRLPDMDGMEVVKQTRNVHPETAVMVITGHPNIPCAVEAMKQGAGHYLPKPFTVDEFREAVEDILKRKKTLPSMKGSGFSSAPDEVLIGKPDVHRALERIGSGVAPALKGNRRSAPVTGSVTKEDLKGKNRPGFLKNLIDDAVDGILACDPEGKVVLYNRRLERMLGYSRDEAIGKMTLNQFFLVGSDVQVREALRSENYGGKNRLLFFETDLLDRTGRRVPVQLSATVLFDAGFEVGIACFFRELSEIRKMEQEFADQARLLHQDKMMSLGRLAASVVHEINNPLAGILNYLRLMHRMLGREPALTPDSAEKFKQYLAFAESETDRCSKIISNLLAFSRKTPAQFGEVNICELLDRCVMLSRHKLEMHNIRITLVPNKSMAPVRGDFNQIQQCIINLIFNAIDAMPEGGIIRIETCFHPGPRVVQIDIRDTGCGIPEETLPRIFDPFFSSKKEGEGLGLGLSTAKGIIERHGGTIDVESVPGKGTVFKICLPAAGG